MKKLVILLLIFSFNFVLADTTFFEEELGYRDDYVIYNVNISDGEVVSPESVELLVSSVSGGGYFAREEYSKDVVCEICSTSLREHINENRNINYNQRDLEILQEEINGELELDLSLNQVAYIIENFEDECDAPFPLLGAVTGGRFRDLLSPVVLVFGIVIFIFVVFLYFIFRAIRKARFDVYKKKSSNKRGKKYVRRNK